MSQFTYPHGNNNAQLKPPHYFRSGIWLYGKSAGKHFYQSLLSIMNNTASVLFQN